MRLSDMQRAFAGKPVLMDQASLAEFLNAEDRDLPDPHDAPCAIASQGAVAVVQVHGMLMDHPGRYDCLFGKVGYQDVLAAVEASILDDSVSAVVLSFSTPGGEAAGAFTFAESLYKLRGIKPLIGLANNSALSAGYFGLAACDRAYVTPGGKAGSVGAAIAHADISKAMEMQGVKWTVIGAGTSKTLGNPYEPLSDESRAALRLEVEAMRDRFVAKVAEYRGMDQAKLKAQESKVYSGQDAVDAGLVDGITTLGELVAELSGAKEATMAGIPGAPAPKPAAAHLAAPIPDTIEAVTAAFPQAVAALRAAGATAERTRIVEVQALAKVGFEAELQAAIAGGLTPEAFALSLVKAEKANPARAMLAAIRKDGDLGVTGSASVVETVTTKPKDETPQGKALALFGRPEIQTKYAGNLGVFLYSEDAEKGLTRDELMNAREALAKKGA